MKVFGEKLKGLNYELRKGVYAVIFNSTMNEVLTVQTSRGNYFLPGGGIEGHENHLQCLEREILEETGYNVVIGPFIGNAKCFFLSTKKKPILNDGYFYFAQLLNKIQDPIDDDHFIKWIETDKARDLLIHAHQNWAVKEGLKQKTSKDELAK
ncbi:NUDIX hydrolase [Solibacillus isronensis]|uniref:NUDIX hydrolase n=1 Tax=Solibacillus isronensis TaxID=412383 RepID=UPI0009A65C1C|nr:NUDIX domain-containing protein [Solibacillus isronensis]